MIATSRAFLRAVACAGFLSAWTAAHAIARPVCRGPRREGWRRNFLGGACRILLRILGVRVRVHGSFGDQTAVMVTNHLGYLDVLVLASLGPAVFVSRADVASWPLIGPLTRWSGTIYLDRERRTEIPHVVAVMQEWLARGTQVVFFPEGTSGSGDELLPFRSSLFEAAVRTGSPIRCAALHYATTAPDAPAREAVSWWGETEFLPHLWGLLQLRGVDATVRLAPEPLRSVDRKAAALEARECVRFLRESTVRERGGRS